MLPAQDVSIGRQSHVGSRHTRPSYASNVQRRRRRHRRNAPCAFNYIIYPIFVQCYVMGRFEHANGPFWMLVGAVLVIFFLPLGPFWFQWAVFDLHWGRFGDGPFWLVPLLCSVDVQHISVLSS